MELTGKASTQKKDGQLIWKDNSKKKHEEPKKIKAKFIPGNIQIIYPCHCTGLLAKCRLMNKFNVEEVGTGLKLKF